MENVTFEGSLKGRANLKGMKPIKLAKDNLKFFAKLPTKKDLMIMKK